MRSGYELEAVSTGTNLVVTGHWSSEARGALERGEADGLVLNYALGFRERDLAFLAGLPIRRLQILARTQSNIEPIYSLSEMLEELLVEVGRTTIDLGRLPNLRRLGADWVQIEDTIAALPELTSLFAHAYTERNLSALSHNEMLMTLRMRDRPMLSSLEGIDAFGQLHTLEMATAPLADLGPLRGASPLIESLNLFLLQRDQRHRRARNDV